MNRIIGTVGGLVVGALVGCASAPYRAVDKDTPPEQVVRVVAAENTQSFGERMIENMGYVSIACVDGIWFRDSLGGFDTVREASFSPGRHYIGIHWWRPEGTGKRWVYAPVWLDAAPGRTYVAQAAMERGVRFWIEDQATGENVGGTLGREPEPEGSGKRCISGEKADGS